MLNKVKHLAKVSCYVPARDPSYRQDDSCNIIAKNTHQLNEKDTK